jgi:T5SS/PEP-CTERM-associated repeat protein
VQSNGAVGATSGVLVIGDAKGSTGTVVLGGTLGGSLAVGEGIIVGNAGGGTLDLQANGGLSLAAGIIEIGAAQSGIGMLALAASGVTLTAPGALLVGASGTGTLQVTAGTSLQANAGTLTIGAASGGVGVLTVSGAAATASLDGLIIGAFGTATLAAASGATIATPNTVVIGEGTGGFGTLTLNGGATSFIDGGDLVVGAAGHGTVSVQGGATLQVNSGAVMIGAVAGASASVTLAGTGTPLQIGSDLTVGQSGTGTLNVQAGVTLDLNGGTVTLGAASAGNGAIMLAGAAAVFSAGHDMTVGGVGHGTLSVGAGAGLSVAGSLDIGAASGGIGTVTLTGSGAAATLGSLVIGDAGSGSLSAGIGGSLVAQDIALGEITNGSGNLLVNGAGATARSTDLTIGLGGTGTLEVTTQGVLDTTGAAVLGTEALPVVQQATILSQAMWTIGSALTVGNAGNAVMVIGTGGTVFAGSVVLGDQGGATGTLTVSGTIGTGGSTFAASSLSFGTDLVVGNAGTAELTVNQGAIVGSPTAPAGTIEIGAQPGGIGTVNVSGAASSLNAAVLAVGGSGGAAGGAGMLSIGAGATVDAGTVIVWGGGTITLGGGDLATDPITVDGEITGYGTLAGAIAGDGTIVASGGTLTLPGSFSGLGTLAFGGVATLVLDTPGSGIALPVTGLAGGDRIEFAGLTITGAHVTSPGTVTISTTGASYLLTDVSFAPGAQQTFITGLDSATGNNYIQVQCFAAGTRIAGPHGEVSVEALRVGDNVALAEGGVADVVWIGHRTVDAARHPQPRKVWPVRIAAGAFGAGMPRRDLLLSPDHAVFVENVLIPVKCLINGSTIVQLPVDSVSYYHVELAQHDVILAEGLPVESYLDTGDRSDFANGGGPVRLHPDFNVLAWEALGCARLVMTGPELDAARARIAAIAMHHSSRHRNIA